MNDKKYPSIALGTWSWGIGTSGGDQVFGNHLEAEELKPVFEAAMDHGLPVGHCCRLCHGRIGGDRRLSRKSIPQR